MMTKKKKTKTITFEEDLRRSNPAMHLFYVKSAIRHLAFLDKTLSQLADFANMNMLDCGIALHREREKLVKQNAAYADAEEILRSLRDGGESC